MALGSVQAGLEVWLRDVAARACRGVHADRFGAGDAWSDERDCTGRQDRGKEVSYGGHGP
jgi:hypothetical protein